MKFQIETIALKSALERVSHALANNSTVPILDTVLIKVFFSQIVFTGNNLEMAIEHIVDKNITIENEGSICIPSKIFTSYVNLLQDDSVSIELLHDNSIEIKTFSSKTRIKGLPATDFPVIPVIKEILHFEIPSSILKKSIEKTLFSSAEGNIRPTLAGIFVKIEETQAKFATTDSFRLSEYKTDITDKLPEAFSQIIPSKTANELKSILNEDASLKIKLSENQISFQFGNSKLFSRLLNGNFPDYEKFFPVSYNTKITLNRIDFVQALKKINLLSKENNYSIKISFSYDTGILIETSETQVGEAKVYLVGELEGDEAIIGLNSEYLLEALQVIDTTHISISFETPLSPILIKGVNDDGKKIKDTFRHIIMPLKI